MQLLCMLQIRCLTPIILSQIRLFVKVNLDFMWNFSKKTAKALTFRQLPYIIYIIYTYTHREFAWGMCVGKRFIFMPTFRSVRYECRAVLLHMLRQREPCLRRAVVRGYHFAC